MTNNSFKSIQILKKWHKKIATLAAFEDIKMKLLASKLVACMFEKHKDEVEEIVKNLKITKS